MTDRIPIKAVTHSGAATALAEFEATDRISGIYLDAQAQNLFGAYAGRPLATAVKVGTLYFASDTQECYHSNGSEWSLVGRGGGELGSSERTSAYSTTSTTFLDIPGLAVDYIAGEGSAFASFCGTGRTNTSQASVGAIFVDGVQCSQVLYTNTAYLTLSSGFRIAGKVPGTTVSVRIRGRASVVGTQFDLFGDDADRPFLRVVAS